MRIPRNPGAEREASTRLRHAIELANPDRDLNLLLTQLLCDLGIEVVDEPGGTVDRDAQVEQVRDVLAGWPIGSGYYTGQVATDEARDMAEAVVDELDKDCAP